eukprot:622156-Karenia_brevis.AAC.1
MWSPALGVLRQQPFLRARTCHFGQIGERVEIRVLIENHLLLCSQVLPWGCYRCVSQAQVKKP